MFQLHIETSLEKNLFFSPSKKINCRLVPGNSSLDQYRILIPTLCETILKKLATDFPFLLTSSSETMHNVRGREFVSFPQDKRPVPRLPEQSEEVLAILGTFLPDEETSETNLPFFYQLSTRFQKFQGSRDILYRQQVQHSDFFSDIREALNPLLICRLVPAQIHTFRLGVERFHPKAFNSFFGLGPALQDRFWLELDKNGLTFSMQIFFSSKRAKDQHRSDLKIFHDAMSQSLQEICQYSPLEEALAKAFLEKAK